MKIRTYADGFGRWHAVVPTVGSIPAQRERARRAIRAEVKVRQGDQHPVIRVAPTPPVSSPHRNPVRVWVEAD